MCIRDSYGSAEKMARMNSASYEKLRSVSRGKFSPQQFLRLKELAANTVGVNNSIFDVELNSLLSLYKSLVKEIDTIEKEINKLIEEEMCIRDRLPIMLSILNSSLKILS